MPRCCFAHVTDLHLSLGATAYGPDGDATLWVDGDGLHERVVTTPAVVAALFAEIARDHPEVEFVVATGDLTNNGEEAEFEAYRRAVAEAPIEVVSIPGNHDHHQGAAAAAAGEPLPYERHLGPRWFSFERGGVHFVAIDWYTHRLGLDTAVQEDWIRADLEAVAADVPVAVLTHDQMPVAWFDALPRRPVASFSGHWHTSRVVDDGRGTVHVNTANATFGGLDYSPPQYRICTIEDGRVDVTTVVRHQPAPPAPAGAPARWVAAVEASHLAGAVLVAGAGLVVVAGTAGRSGAVTAIDVDSGATRWQVPLAAPVKAAPTVDAGLLVAVSVAGEVVAIDGATGTVRWRAELHPDPLYLWCHVSPVVGEGLVYAGDVGSFAALDAASGNPVWSRDDLGRRENLTTFGRPALVDGLLVGTFAGQSPALWALDPATGVTRWPTGGVHGIYESGADLARELPQVVVGGITPDPEGRDCYVTRLGSRVERLRAADGSVVWSTPGFGWFNPAPPVVVGDAVVVTAATGSVRSYDRATGTLRWCTELGGDGPVAFGSYRADGPSLLAPVTPSPVGWLQPLSDGRVVTMDPETGAVTATVAVGVPVTAPVLVVDGDVVVVGIDGSVRRLPLR